MNFSWVDIVIALIILFYGVEGYVIGGVHAFFDLLMFVTSFLVGLKTYQGVGSLIARFIAIPRGLAKAAGFFLVVSLVELLLKLLLRKSFGAVHLHLEKRVPVLNRILGVVFGMISGSIFVMILISIIVSIPISPFIKNAITSSYLGNIFLSQSQMLEKSMHGVFDDATAETMNFLTVKPDSNSTVHLQFTANGTIDTTSEQQMLVMVNNERVKRGVHALVMESALQQIARAHAQDMLKRGYFSHYTPEGLSPFDRMKQENIDYEYAGENLALSPDVSLAMQGLMNSPGHRENILYTHFNKVGIGVMDGGVYGKMFVQEFTN